MKKLFLFLSFLLLGICCFAQSRYISKTTKKIVYARDGGRCRCCGSSIDLVERIARKDHALLYQAVVTLTMLARADDLEEKTFKAMDKVCQLIYGTKAAIKK